MRYFAAFAFIFVFCLLLLLLLSLVMCLWGCLDVVTLTFEIHFRHKEFRPGRLSGFCRYNKKLWRGKSILYLNGNISFLQFFCIRYDNDEDESMDVIRRGEGSRWASDISTDYC